MNKTTQYDRILNHLRTKGHITSLQAFRDYGISRLSAVIFNLRKDGYRIDKDFVTRPNRYGDKVTFAKYKLIEQTKMHI